MISDNKHGLQSRSRCQTYGQYVQDIKIPNMVGEQSLNLDIYNIPGDDPELGQSRLQEVNIRVNVLYQPKII